MQVSKEQQHFFMKQAISLGEKGRLTAPPNPWVGCVIVKEGKIVGEGYHREAGTPHAEIHALNQAAEQARGATAYISLEPCVHFGKTPPCAAALIEAGIAEVVIAILDPDPKVQGKGVETLRRSGINVIVGVEEDLAKKVYEPYLFQRSTKRPYCILKSACSLDGKVAAQDGSSKWISSSAAREDAHMLRASCQAILIGTQTAVCDNPELTVRLQDFPLKKQPLRVVLDAQGKIPLKSALFNQTIAPTLVFTSESCPLSRQKEWKSLGIEVEIVSRQQGQLHIEEILEKLAEKGIIQLLVEGGPTLLSHFIEKKLAQKLVLYLAPCLLGDKGKSLFSSPILNIHDAKRFSLIDMQRFSDDVRLNYQLFFV